MPQPPYTTSGNLIPFDVLTRFENRPVILIACAVETTRPKTDRRRPKIEQEEYQRMYLDEIGVWVGTLWQQMLSAFPGIEGQQMLWHSLFFVVASEDIEAMKSRFQNVLKSIGFSHAVVRCILAEANASAEELLHLVDDAVGEAGFQPYFGWDKRFKYRLVNGENWLPNAAHAVE